MSKDVSPKKRKETSAKKKVMMFWVGIVVFLMVGSLFGIMSSNLNSTPKAKTTTYNGYDFHSIVMNNQNMWETNYFHHKLYFFNDPNILSNEGILSKIKAMPWGERLSPPIAYKKVYLTINSSNLDKAYLGTLSTMGLSKNLAYNGVALLMGFIDNNTEFPNLSGITCDNSTNSTLVIEYIPAINNSLKIKNNCITLSYKSPYDIAPYTEGIEYALLGILRVE